MEDLMKQFKDQVARVDKHFDDELKKIRTGRANPSLLDGIEVDVYEQKTPLNHVAKVLASDAKTLTITPYDPSTVSAITQAIREDQALGLNPVDDGKIIRVPLPEMTSDRRDQIIKQVYAKAEESRISLRNIRHSTLDEAKQAKNDGTISEDDYHRFEQDLASVLDEANKKIDEKSKEKEEEIRTI